MCNNVTNYLLNYNRSLLWSNGRRICDRQLNLVIQFLDRNFAGPLSVDGMFLSYYLFLKSYVTVKYHILYYKSRLNRALNINILTFKFTREKKIFIISEYLFSRYFTDSKELIRRDMVEYFPDVNENADLSRRTLKC